jgi:hypothetical protein
MMPQMLKRNRMSPGDRGTQSICSFDVRDSSQQTEGQVRIWRSARAVLRVVVGRDPVERD